MAIAMVSLFSGMQGAGTSHVVDLPHFLWQVNAERF